MQTAARILDETCDPQKIGRPRHGMQFYDAVMQWIVEDEPDLIYSMQPLREHTAAVRFELHPGAPGSLPNATWLGIEVSYFYVETGEEISKQLYYLVERASGDVYLADFEHRIESTLRHRISNVYGTPRGVVVDNTKG